MPSCPPHRQALLADRQDQVTEDAEAPEPSCPPPYWQALLADRQDQVTEDAEALLIALPDKLLGMETVRVVGAVRAEGRGGVPDQLLGMETVRIVVSGGGGALTSCWSWRR